jgi:hypothetical protein
MGRLWSAFREWLEIRARLREEYRFHLDRAAADLCSLGLSRRAAKRAARVRFGSRLHLRIALREIGGHPAGLVRLFRAYRVSASVLLGPVLLLGWVALALCISPAPKLLIESIIGRPLGAESRQTVFFSVPAPWPLFTGINTREFEALRSLSTLTAVERYRTIYVRARSGGGSLTAVEAEARVRTGNSGIRAVSLFDQRRIQMGPAAAVWILVAFFAFVSLRSHMPHRGRPLWLLYAVLLGCLHVLASMLFWALAVQIWSSTSWPTRLAEGLSFSTLLVSYILITALQCRYWLRDLYQRCPVCLESLLLRSTQGAGNRVLLSTAVTESVCSHGHGVLVETRWMRQFRCEESPFEGLVRA